MSLGGMTKQVATWTEPTPGVIQVQIGSDTIQFPLAQIVAIDNGERPYWILLAQAYLALFQAGVRPSTASLSQMATVLNSTQLYWGN